MTKAVYCLTESETQAEQILNDLQAAGLPGKDISVLWPDGNKRFGLSHENETKAPEGATTGATTGGVVGGLLGWLAGIGALAIPGLGPLVAAGPIMGLLSGAAVGATVGGITGGLIGLGIPEYEAKRYEEGLRSGKVLVSCRCHDDDQAKACEELFKRSGARDICSVEEKSDKQLSDLQQQEFGRDTKEHDVIDAGPPVVRPPADVYTGTSREDYNRPL